MESADVTFWIEKITAAQDEDLLLKAKEEYQKFSGTVFQDDKSYEARMGLFLEWYILNYRLPLSNQIPLLEYREANRETLSPDQVTSLETLSHSLHGIFRVTQSSAQNIKVYELFEDKDYRVHDKEGKIFFNKNDLFEGNLFLDDNQNIFSGNFVYHSPDAFKFIKGKVKSVRAIEKESANKLKLKEKEVAAAQKKLQGCEKAVSKLAAKIEKTTKPEKREKLEQEHREKERNQNEARAELDQADKILEEFRKGEMGEILKARRFELIQQLSYMSLKWERSRQIDLHDIYSD